MSDLRTHVTAFVHATTEVASNWSHLAGAPDGTTCVRIGSFLEANVAFYVDDADAHAFLTRLRDECAAALARVPGGLQAEPEPQPPAPEPIDGPVHEPEPERWP